MPDEIGRPSDDEAILEWVHDHIAPSRYTDAVLAGMRHRAFAAARRRRGVPPSQVRHLIDAIEAGLTEGGDVLTEEIDDATHEILSEGRRVPFLG